MPSKKIFKIKLKPPGRYLTIGTNRSHPLPRWRNSIFPNPRTRRRKKAKKMIKKRKKKKNLFKLLSQIFKNKRKKLTNKPKF